MPKVAANDPLSHQNLAAAVWYTVAKIAEEEVSLGKDLERFAFHAGRNTVGVDDVKYEHITTEAVRNGLALSEVKTTTTMPKARARPRVSEGAIKASAAKKAATAAVATTSKRPASKKQQKVTKVQKVNNKDVKGKGKAIADSSSSSDSGDNGSDKVIDFAIMSQDDIDDASSENRADEDEDAGSSMDDGSDEDLPKRKKGKLRRGTAK
ncbi:hypothetical protein OIV83_000831 [Microbotryomycetes sp. JL201]|nr:hypothetical protein OIV83_000831 [Microbotryomycetes sp. JL201]